MILLQRRVLSPVERPERSILQDVHPPMVLEMLGRRFVPSCRSQFTLRSDQFTLRSHANYSSVKQDVIDSRYFENQMNTFPLFRENFCVTPTTHKALARATKLEAKVRAAHPDQRAAFTSCLTFACLRVNSLRPLSCE